MRTVGLAPEAITWAAQVPTVKWRACFECQSRGCHRSHGWGRDASGFSRALCCESRDAVTWQVGRSSLGLCRAGAREAPGRIAVSAGRKESPCGTGLGHGQGTGSRDSDSETRRWMLSCTQSAVVRVAVEGAAGKRDMGLARLHGASVASASTHRN